MAEAVTGGQAAGVRRVGGWGGWMAIVGRPTDRPSDDRHRSSKQQAGTTANSERRERNAVGGRVRERSIGYCIIDGRCGFVAGRGAELIHSSFHSHTKIAC
jgi:hypothetical protein